MNILLLEDDTAIAAALETFLTEKGCRVTCCDSLSRARSLLETALPDVAVLDWNLPDGEGTDLCRELRQRRPRPCFSPKRRFFPLRFSPWGSSFLWRWPMRCAPAGSFPPT